MPKVIDLDTSSMGGLRSSVSHAVIDSTRRSSLRQYQSEKDPTANTMPKSPPPPPRSTRKRAASLDLENGNEPRLEDLALDSAGTNGPSTSDSIREQMCLCQPDPKIPRPRNAFILYRQHYQAQVVAQHPGLANPDISKIIGEQWRDQTPETKSEWRKLAEEEKLRHQRQYPGYRYQPRRAGKTNGIGTVSSASPDGPSRCPKCNGRYITTPSTPLTPFTPVSNLQGGSNERKNPSLNHNRAGEIVRSRYLPEMPVNRIDSPRAPPHHMQRRPQYPPPHNLPTHHERDEEMDLLSPSPDQKRRRLHDNGQRNYPISSPISYGGPQSFPRSGPPPNSAGGYRQQHLPGPGMMARQGNMGPPHHQYPLQQSPRHPYPTRSSTFDESLRLPPLQTQIPATPSQRQDLRRESRDAQARSIEAMVMTIPYINKIKVLSKICPPLPPPGPTSPVPEIRGAVVAVEGQDHALLAEIGAFVAESLTNDPSYNVKTWGVSEPPKIVDITTAMDTEMIDAKTSSSPADASNPFIDYLSIIADMHKKSQAIAKYISTSPSTSDEAEDTPSKTKRTPVALLPAGFSLTTSDVFALKIPINDSYAPVDHWQWMATLWRGIVGPDLTVHVQRVGKEELSKYGGVEIRGDCAAIVVRVAEGSDGIDEKTARRLGFEVLEFVRAGEGTFGRN